MGTLRDFADELWYRQTYAGSTIERVLTDAAESEDRLARDRRIAAAIDATPPGAIA